MSPAATLADWSFPLEEKVLGLRLQFPRWGKDKLAVLLRRQQLSVSTSMVGRILTRLKQQGRLVEPPRTGVSGSRRALRSRPYAVRKPKQYAVSEPGDLVEVDTLDVRPVPGVIFKQFTARDVVSRWDGYLMPEEINRLLTDQISEFLFTPSCDADENLRQEGIATAKVYLVGNVMIDTLVRFLPRAEEQHNDGVPERYALVTLHRPSNVDDLHWLRELVEGGNRQLPTDQKGLSR